MTETKPADDAPQTRLTVGIKRVDSALAAVRERAPGLLRWARLIGYPAAVALVAYVGYRASKGVSFDSLRPLPIAIATVLFAVYWTLLGRGWSVISGSHVTRQGMATWCRTQVLRYVPGSFLAPAARATSVEGRKRDKLATIVGEQVVQLCAGIGVAGILLTIGGSPLFAPLIVAFAVPFGIHHLIRGRTTLSDRRMLHAGLWYVVAFLVYGAANVCAQIGVGHTTDNVRIAGAACLAWAVGVVIIFAPGGLGAREAVYVKLLGSRLPVGVPAAGALAGRLASIIAELLVLLIVAGPWYRRRDAAHRDAALAAEAAESRLATERAADSGDPDESGSLTG